MSEGIGEYAAALQQIMQVGNPIGEGSIEAAVLRAQQLLRAMDENFRGVTDGSNHPSIERTQAHLTVISYHLGSALGALYQAQEEVTERYLPDIDV